MQLFPWRNKVDSTHHNGGGERVPVCHTSWTGGPRLDKRCWIDWKWIKFDLRLIFLLRVIFRLMFLLGILPARPVQQPRQHRSLLHPCIATCCCFMKSCSAICYPGVFKTMHCKCRSLVKQLYAKEKINSTYGGTPLVSQHSRSQALVKEEGCVRRGEPM